MNIRRQVPIRGRGDMRAGLQRIIKESRSSVTSLMTHSGAPNSLKGFIDADHEGEQGPDCRVRSAMKLLVFAGFELAISSEDFTREYVVRSMDDLREAMRGVAARNGCSVTAMARRGGQGGGVIGFALGSLEYRTKEPYRDLNLGSLVSYIEAGGHRIFLRQQFGTQRAARLAVLSQASQRKKENPDAGQAAGQLNGREAADVAGSQAAPAGSVAHAQPAAAVRGALHRPEPASPLGNGRAAGALDLPPTRAAGAHKRRT